MPKIAELTNAQLNKLIEKHSKILTKLQNEKRKRFPAKDIASELDLDLSQSAYQLNLEQEGIDQEKVEKELQIEKEDSDMIRVTRLLTLSPAQLEALHKNKKIDSKK